MPALEDMLRSMVIAPKSGEELFEQAVRRSKRVEAKGARGLSAIKRLEEARVTIAANFIASKLEGIALKTPFLKELHPFYRELISTMINVDEYRACLARIHGAAKITRKIAREAKVLIRKAEDAKAAARGRRMFFGRTLSLLSELTPCLSRIREFQLEMLKLPSIDPNLKTIIIAGVPNVGKSSLLRAVSRAKPEVKPYPFTTKTIIVGHISIEDEKIQVIDTPGLLDRPLEEKNKIELRAILAMKHLKGVIIYLFYPSETCGYTLDYQLKVYSSLVRWFPDVSIFIAANKVDITPREKARELLALLGPELSRKVYFISALKRMAVNVLLEDVLRTLCA